MSTAKLLPVQFHSDTIFCVNVNDQPFAPVKPIVENMGLTWQAQAAKLRANEARWGITIIMIPSESGEQRTLCMPVRKLPAFFASINPNKVRPELRDKIELYQNECDNALWAYWTEGQAVRPPSSKVALTASTADDRKPLRSLVHAWAQIAGTSHTALWPQVKAHFQLARIDDLPVEWIPDALAFVQGKIDAGQKALPEGEQELAEAPIPVRILDQFPKDMSTGRKDALKKIEAILKQFYGLRDVVRLFTHPGGHNTGRNMSDKERYEILLNLYRSADANLAAAYNALEAGYRLGREVGRG